MPPYAAVNVGLVLLQCMTTLCSDLWRTDVQTGEIYS